MVEDISGHRRQNTSLAGFPAWKGSEYWEKRLLLKRKETGRFKSKRNPRYKRQKSPVGREEQVELWSREPAKVM
jgi:hypothetical protein